MLGALRVGTFCLRGQPGGEVAETRIGLPLQASIKDILFRQHFVQL